MLPSTYTASPRRQLTDNTDDFSLWIWTQNSIKRIQPLSLGLRLLAAFVLVTFTVETFLFISSAGYYLYSGRGVRTVTSIQIPNVETVTQVTVNVTTARPSPSRQEIIANFTEYLRDFCHRKPVVMDKNLPSCPCVSPHLQGNSPVRTKNIPSIGELELNLTEIKPGGYFQPKECSPRHHVAIIVPFRDRESHLKIFLHHMHPFLQRQLIEYRIFVVEEVPHKIFNKAMMMNIGFVEARKLFNADCVIFHDVDMIPEDDRNLYACVEKPRHMGAYCSKWKYELPYYQLFGGAISLTPAQFIKVNGYSNEYFGWGGEDDDMYNRVRANKINITRYPPAISRYWMLHHGHDRGNPYNHNSNRAFRPQPKHYRKDGLNTLKYDLKNIEHRPLYTWIQADIAVPSYVQKQVKKSGKVRLAASGSLVWIIVLPIVIILNCNLGLR